ncbi:MAG TPA: 2-C-methyl-D-erythritol 2,4-cyclodiphosphate synthase, partial [Mycobacteriales bacterium]|nr:2-C-methyl-D-erythritol 2,4-cyclodiphosphate synthase [Mycobacteriales bacterium]
LQEVVGRVTAEGWRIQNVAVSLVAGSPRFSPRREDAQETLSAVVGAPVTISASTTDGLGFIGRNEGRAATATALLTRSP